MDFTLDAKQQELVNLAKEIAQKEIAPRALDIDKSGHDFNSLRFRSGYFSGNFIFILRFRKACGLFGTSFFTGRVQTKNCICT